VGARRFRVHAVRKAAHGLRSPKWTSAFSGEADVVFPQLVERLDAPWTVPGILWRDDEGSIMENGAATCCQKLG